jgi:hypothetical protein
LSNESRSCPEWYVDTLELKHRRLMDSLLGEGRWEYADEYLEPWTESAREAEPKGATACYQKWFPGLSPSFNYATASF